MQIFGQIDFPVCSDGQSTGAPDEGRAQNLAALTILLSLKTEAQGSELSLGLPSGCIDPR